MQAWTTAYDQYQKQSKYRVPGHRALPGTGSFPYGELNKFHAVDQARKEWDGVKARLDKMASSIADQAGK